MEEYKEDESYMFSDARHSRVIEITTHRCEQIKICPLNLGSSYMDDFSSEDSDDDFTLEMLYYVSQKFRLDSGGSGRASLKASEASEVGRTSLEASTELKPDTDIKIDPPCKLGRKGKDEIIIPPRGMINFARTKQPKRLPTKKEGNLPKKEPKKKASTIITSKKSSKKEYQKNTAKKNFSDSDDSEDYDFPEEECSKIPSEDDQKESEIPKPTKEYSSEEESIQPQLSPRRIILDNEEDEEEEQKPEQVDISIVSLPEEYQKIIHDRDQYLNENPGKIIGKNFWYRLTIEEKECVYRFKKHFCAYLNAKGSNLKEEYINTMYKFQLKENFEYRKTKRALAKMKNKIEENAQKLVIDKDITEEFYQIITKGPNRPKITSDYKVIVHFTKQLLPLEAVPQDTLGSIEGFEEYDEFGRNLLMNLLIDKRDAVSTVNTILNDEGLKINTEDILDEFARSGHLHGYRIKGGTVLGVRALVDEDKMKKD